MNRLIILAGALLLAITLNGCSDDAAKTAGPAAGLYFVQGEDILNGDTLSASDAEPLIPEYIFEGFGMISETGEAAFFGLDDYNEPFVYYGNISGSAPDLPEGPVDGAEFEAALGGKLDIFYADPFVSFDSPTAFIGEATIRSGTLTEENHNCWPREDIDELTDETQSFLIIVGDILDPDTLEPGDSPYDVNFKYFCADISQEYADADLLEPAPPADWIFEGEADDAELIPEYEKGSSLANLAGYYQMQPYGFSGPFPSVYVEISEDGVVSEVGAESDICSIDSRFEIINEDYNIYRYSANTSCEGVTIGITGLASQTDALFDERIGEPCIVSEGPCGPCLDINAADFGCEPCYELTAAAEYPCVDVFSVEASILEQEPIVVISKGTLSSSDTGAIETASAVLFIPAPPPIP